MARRRQVELSINHERWLVSYSDFITLLFAFFVVMYSVSQVNESKYRVLSDTLVKAFNNEPQKSISPIQIGQPSLAIEPSVIALGEGEKTGEYSGEGAFEKTADLPQLADQFSDQFSDLVEDELVRINSNEFWLQVELKSSILFASGQAEPGLQARAIFSEVANMLKVFNNPVQVEGFTDNVPIGNRRYASNWELSAARAAAVVKLLAENGVTPQRLSAVGYGEFQPISANDTDAGRAENRRVVLMIAREKQKRPGISASDQLERVVAGAQSTQSIASESENAIVPVELEGGGLLFSSDPDLPRNTQQ